MSGALEDTKRVPAEPTSGPEDASEALSRGDAAKLLKRVRVAALRYAGQKNLLEHVDDIAGDTVVMLMEQFSRGQRYVTDGAFINHATRAVASRYSAPGVHHRDIKARAILNSRIESFAQDNGREPKAAERRALADEVRLSFAAGRRPTLGYDTRTVRTISLDAPLRDEPGRTIMDKLIESEVAA